ncbi:MAG: PAS domain S-box protein [Rhodoferax sp.]|nr:PAS domain S-box protein [Rhodoferax sp.]
MTEAPPWKTTSPQRLPEGASGAALQPMLEHVIELYDSLELRYERLRQAYANLLERHEELNEQIRAMRDIHLITDLRGTILQSNRSGLALAPLHRLVGSNLRDWVEPTYLANFETLRAFAVRASVPAGEERELRLICQSNTADEVTVSAQVLAVEEGSAVQALHWVLRDVRPLADQPLDHVRPLVQFERVSECVFMTDAQGKILAVNAAFSRITGYGAAEVIGRNPRFLQSGLQDRTFYRDFWRELLSAGFWQGHIFNRKKNGEIYSQWLKVSASRDASGQVLSYTAVFYDLSRTAPVDSQHQTDTLAQPLEHTPARL